MIWYGRNTSFLCFRMSLLSIFSPVAARFERSSHALAFKGSDARINPGKTVLCLPAARQDEGVVLVVHQDRRQAGDLFLHGSGVR